MPIHRRGEGRYLKTEIGKEETSIKVKPLKWLLPVCLIIAGLFFTLGASHYTSRTDYCMSCHEMDKAVSTWQASAHGTNEPGISAQCKDCHIPRGTTSMLITKVGKLSELYVHVVESPSEFEYARMRPDLAERARSKIVDDNCLACHNLDQQIPQNQTQQIAHSTAVNKTSCVSCHNTVGHYENYEKEGELR